MSLLNSSILNNPPIWTAWWMGRATHVNSNQRTKSSLDMHEQLGKPEPHIDCPADVASPAWAQKAVDAAAAGARVGEAHVLMLTGHIASFY